VVPAEQQEEWQDYGESVCSVELIRLVEESKSLAGFISTYRVLGSPLVDALFARLAQIHGRNFDAFLEKCIYADAAGIAYRSGFAALFPPV
jgi:hypothetical protein